MNTTITFIAQPDTKPRLRDGLRLLPGIFLFSLLTPALAIAQNSQELRNLLFEPVLITHTDAQEGALYEAGEVYELTVLPGGEKAGSVSTYLVNQALQEAEELTFPNSESIGEYEERIKDLELDGGAYEPALTQEMMSVGSLYQQQGDHLAALEYLDQALHINRVNLGLFNLDQEEIIDQKIASHVALGDLRAADLQQEYLMYIKRKAYGSTSVELLPALAEYAEWNIFAFDSRLAMDPTLSYAADSNIYQEDTVNNSIGEDDLRTVRLMNAQNIYRTILNIILNNYGLQDPRLLEIEKKLALTNYFFATNLDVMSDVYSGKNSSLALNSSQGFYEMSRVSSNSMGYRHGREALERRLEYMLKMEGVSDLEIARARIDLGDWLLLFKKRSAALTLYQEAYDALSASEEISRDEIDALFSPVLPVTIPTFIDYRYSRKALGVPGDIPLEYQGWIDLSFRINRYGKPQNVEILGQSENTTEPISTRLLRQIRNSTSYRPRIAEGTLVEMDNIEARYYYSY